MHVRAGAICTNHNFGVMDLECAEICVTEHGSDLSWFLGSCVHVVNIEMSQNRVNEKSPLDAFRVLWTQWIHPLIRGKRVRLLERCCWPVTAIWSELQSKAYLIVWSWHVVPIRHDWCRNNDLRRPRQTQHTNNEFGIRSTLLLSPKCRGCWCAWLLSGVFGWLMLNWRTIVHTYVTICTASQQLFSFCANETDSCGCLDVQLGLWELAMTINSVHGMGWCETAQTASSLRTPLASRVMRRPECHGTEIAWSWKFVWHVLWIHNVWDVVKNVCFQCVNCLACFCTYWHAHHMYKTQISSVAADAQTSDTHGSIEHQQPWTHSHSAPPSQPHQSQNQMGGPCPLVGVLLVTSPCQRESRASLGNINVAKITFVWHTLTRQNSSQWMVCCVPTSTVAQATGRTSWQGRNTSDDRLVKVSPRQRRNMQHLQLRSSLAHVLQADRV